MDDRLRESEFADIFMRSGFGSKIENPTGGFQSQDDFPNVHDFRNLDSVKCPFLLVHTFSFTFAGPERRWSLGHRDPCDLLAPKR